MQHKDKQSPKVICLYLQIFNDTSHYLPLLAASVPLIDQIFIPIPPLIAQSRAILPSPRLDQNLSEFLLSKSSHPCFYESMG